MNEFIASRGVSLDGDDELLGLNIGQPHVGPGTTLFGPASAEYVWIVEDLFRSWPVMLMIGDPAQFHCGEEPWFVEWLGGSTPLGDRTVIPQRPAVNRNIHAVADQAKHAYAKGTQKLAAIQYRLGELAGKGLLDPEEATSLQGQLVGVWDSLYHGTLCAVRDEDTDDSTWDQADNTYSDGRQVVHQIRVEPEPTAWGREYDRFTLGDGAVADHPRGTVTCILHPDNKFDTQTPGNDETRNESLAERLRRHRNGGNAADRPREC
ncbi:hypothetical protein [Mycolicibacterium aichiense]|nr:hypothetical protein [Mycolicibacterium aichiense]MCV7017654.1 hypothetical protein [Mycolicibacterium aichiense]